MTIRVKIGRREVNNPIVKFLVGIVGLVVLTLVLALMFFVILPLIWFLALSVLLLAFVVLLIVPKVVDMYYKGSSERPPPLPGDKDRKP